MPSLRKKMLNREKSRNFSLKKKKDLNKTKKHLKKKKNHRRKSKIRGGAPTSSTEIDAPHSTDNDDSDDPWAHIPRGRSPNNHDTRGNDDSKIIESICTKNPNDPCGTHMKINNTCITYTYNEKEYNIKCLYMEFLDSQLTIYLHESNKFNSTDGGYASDRSYKMIPPHHKIENIKKIAVEDEKLIFTCDNRDTHTIIPGTWENTEVTPKEFKDVKETIVKYCREIAGPEDEGTFTIGTFSEPEPETSGLLRAMRKGASSLTGQTGFFSKKQSE